MAMTSYQPDCAHRTGGHSAGLQFVSVHTKRGWVVLALMPAIIMSIWRATGHSPSPSVGEMMESFDQLKKTAPSLSHIIPGHDLRVMENIQPLKVDGLMVRLDEPPKIANYLRLFQ